MIKRYGDEVAAYVNLYGRLVLYVPHYQERWPHMMSLVRHDYNIDDMIYSAVFSKQGEPHAEKGESQEEAQI